MKGCVGKCVGSVGAGVGGCPYWTPSGRFLWENPGQSLIQRRGSSPREQHGQQLSKALGALCRVRAKSQSVPKSRVPRAAGISHPRLSLCEAAPLRGSSLKRGGFPASHQGGREGISVGGRSARSLFVMPQSLHQQPHTPRPVL